jgi:sortase A
VKAIVVTATDRNRNHPTWANRADTDWGVAAPGDAIVSTVTGGGYAVESGTSMSTPHVSGVAAMLLAQGLSNSQVVQRILSTAHPLGPRVSDGAGLVDAAAAVGAPAKAAAAPAPAPAPAAATPTTSSPRKPSPARATVPPTTTTAVPPPATLPAETTGVKAPPTDGRVRDDGPVVQSGTIEIPKIGLVHPIFEGNTLTQIDHGPSHWPGTAMPGQRGNAVFAGHRVTHTHPFRHIDQLQPGDLVYFTVAGARWTYRVSDHQVVTPKDTWIVAQTPEATATLFACHPPGSARYRYVVRLELVPSAG